MEKEYSHKFIENRQAHPDQESFLSLKSPALFEYFKSPLKGSTIHLRHLAEINRGDIIRCRNWMQNPDSDQHQDETRRWKPTLNVPPNNGTPDFGELLETFGWDVIKFTLALSSKFPSDRSLFLNRIVQARAFTRKVWNASRFVIMNLKGNEDQPLNTTKIQTADKWFLHRLNTQVDLVNQKMDQSQVQTSARMLHRFFRQEFCSWYLEFSKEDIQYPETRKALKISLLTLLKCLHPFIPFLSTEIDGKIDPDGIRPGTDSFPQFNSRWVFLNEHTVMEQMKELITKTRIMRSEYRLSFGKPLLTYIMIHSSDNENQIKANLEYYKRMIPTRTIKIVDEFSKLPGGFKTETQNIKILLIPENETEKKNIMDKLNHDFNQTKSRIHDTETKLSDRRFADKAQEMELAALKRILIRSYKTRDKIQKAINDLSQAPK